MTTYEMLQCIERFNSILNGCEKLKKQRLLNMLSDLRELLSLKNDFFLFQFYQTVLEELFDVEIV